MLFLCFLARGVLGDAESVAIGIKGRGFVAMAADAAFRRGIVSMDDAVDKVFELNDRQLLCAVGDVGEAEEFCQLIRQNLVLHTLRGAPAPSGAEVAHFLRRELVASRRERRKMPHLKLLLGAVDELHWLDETGARTEIPFAAHGLGSSLVLGHLDQAYDEDIDPQRALDLLQECLALLRQRYAASTAAGFIVKLFRNDHRDYENTSCSVFRYSPKQQGLVPIEPLTPIPTMRLTTVSHDRLSSTVREV